jgi:hypothetical protein
MPQESLERLTREANAGDLDALYRLNQLRYRAGLPSLVPFLVLGPNRLFVDGRVYRKGELLLTTNTDSLSLHHAVLSGLLLLVPTRRGDW